MDYIDRMPVIISLSASILLGFISYYSMVDTDKIYIILSISLVVFYIIGVFIKNTVKQVAEQVIEVQNQQLEEEKRLQEERRLEEEEKKRLEDEKNRNTNDKTEAAPSIIDFSVGGKDDEFIPFQFENGKEKTASVK
jgi:predicted Holliday junction resolvase-like endonuclease